MSQDRLDDLYDRLSSRKLWLTVLSIAFAAWNHAEGRLSAVEFQTAIFGAVTAFSIAEGAADAVAAYRPKPSGDEQTVNVSTETLPPAVPAAVITTDKLASSGLPAKRIRPSRAKSKANALKADQERTTRAHAEGVHWPQGRGEHAG